MSSIAPRAAMPNGKPYEVTPHVAKTLTPHMMSANAAVQMMTGSHIGQEGSAHV